VLVGSLEIPERFPELIETYLARGGVDWPDIPGLREAIAQDTQTEEAATLSPQPTAPRATPEPAFVTPAVPSPTATPGLILPGEDNPGWRQKFARDLAGNTLSVVVLVSMIGAVIWAAVLFQRMGGVSLTGSLAWTIPLLSLVGFSVAGYLAYVETAQVTAVCGPVGDCNTVQQSEYARLFGVLPIGVLGLIGYTAIFISWLIIRYANDRLADLAVISIFTMTVFGTLFSIYLTFLEPFVIGAACAWCLSSAIIMTILMLLSIAPGKLATRRLMRRN